MEIPVTIEQLKLQCWRTWKECAVTIKNPANCSARRISYTCLLPHLASLLGRQQLLEQSEEFGKVLVVTTTMNCCEGPQIHLDDWPNEDNEMFPLLHAEQETSPPTSPFRRGSEKKSFKSERWDKCDRYFTGGIKKTAVDLSEGTATKVPCLGF